MWQKVPSRNDLTCRGEIYDDEQPQSGCSTRIPSSWIELKFLMIPLSLNVRNLSKLSLEILEIH
jgi:hypothetical protein